MRFPINSALKKVRFPIGSVNNCLNRFQLLWHFTLNFCDRKIRHLMFSTKYFKTKMSMSTKFNQYHLSISTKSLDDFCITKERFEV